MRVLEELILPAVALTLLGTVYFAAEANFFLEKAKRHYEAPPTNIVHCEPEKPPSPHVNASQPE